ncbi:hypothetical protein Mgra_00009014, partial [Meloidogyne graminicola]
MSTTRYIIKWSINFKILRLQCFKDKSGMLLLIKRIN